MHTQTRRPAATEAVRHPAPSRRRPHSDARRPHTQPVRQISRRQPTARRDPGCVLSIKPFGEGVAYRLTDPVTDTVLEKGTAPNRDFAVTRSRTLVRKRFGAGEPITCVEVL